MKVILMTCKLHRKRQIIHDYKNRRILIVPSAETGRGGGHLCRCISLTNELRAMGRETFLFITPQSRDLTGLYHSMEFNPKWCLTNEELEIRNEKLKEGFDFIVLDRFQTPLNELLRWKKIAPVIGIDEGGSCRDRFDFLVDMLIPEKLGNPPANISSPSLLFKTNLTADKQEPTQTKEKLQSKNSCGLCGSELKIINKPFKVLITFGQEDSAGLGFKIARELSAMKNSDALDITLLRGALADNNEERTKNKEGLQKVHILENIPQLARHLCEYDLVITHYGITAYESAYIGTPVLLAHPTPYHRKLATAAGFWDIKYLNSFLNSAANTQNLTTVDRPGVPTQTIGRLRSASSCGLCGSWLKNDNLSLAKLCNSFSPKVNRFCPVCGMESGCVISRFSDRTYRRCSKCGVICMDRINPAPVEYEKEYFFESYKQQYGKTYLEDFDNIKEAGKRRLKLISRLTYREAETKRPQNNNGVALLDIGCAYGPFLAAAKEEGFSPSGIDPAEDAVKYVQEKLGISAVKGFFPISHSPFFIPNSFDVITLWFVMEHFTDCVSVLAEIHKLLKPGGILAFSTPSFSGISALSSPRRFLSSSPADHWTVWSPKTCKKALALSGFKVKKIVIAGHHPERFPFLGRFAKSRKSPLYWALLAISKFFGTGDTFEVYAQKISL